MTGLTDYSSKNTMNNLTGQTPAAATPSVWLGLFTAVGTDANTGFTEVSGGSYARVQLAGQLAASSAATTVITFGAVPSWVVAGMSVNDVTTPGNVPANTVVNSVTATTVTCNNTVSGVGTDTIRFSAFTPSTGSAPSSVVNNSVINFAQASANWGTVIAWGLFDAVTSGNLLWWDFMGNFAWLPFESTALATGVGPTFTAKAHGYASNDPIVFTTEYGGAFPTLSVGTMTGYTASFAGTIATDTFTAFTTSGPTTSFASSTTGSGDVRKITQQSIPSGVTASFAASTFTLSLA